MSGIATLTGLGIMTGMARADALPDTILNANGVLQYTSVTLNAQNPTHGVFVSFPNGPSGYGGGFAAVVDGYNTTVWCVDVEEDANFGTTYHADLVSTADLTGSNLNDVKYGNVTGGAWNLSLDPGNDTAAIRYKMAAYIASQDYANFPNGPANDAYDLNVQLAIWEVMYNTSIPSASPSWSSLQALAAPNSSTIAGYISAAETFVDNNPNSPYFNNFAIVSGSANPDGSMSTSGEQTYLVQLGSPSVPEPSTWMPLFAGLALLPFAKMRLGRQPVAAKHKK